MPRQFNGVYDTMTFPPYVYREYPKWITLRDGTQITVDSKAEELRAIANDSSEAPRSLEEVANEALAAKEAEIEALKAQLKAVSQEREKVIDPNALPSGSALRPKPKA